LRNRRTDRGPAFDQVRYIAAGAAAAFFVRRVFRRAFFAPLRRVFLAAPRAPTLRTVRFFFAFDFRFFAVIGM